MKPSDSAKSTPGASASCDDTGQMSLFGETSGRWDEPKLGELWPTPVAKDDNKFLPAYLRMRERYDQAPNVTSLNVMIKAGLSPSSPQGIPASHSHSPGSDWARKMTATYGRKFGAYWLSCDPPDSWARTLLGTSIWGSMTCYLTWKKSATPAGRLLFRLVPSTPRTAGIGSGLWGTPTSRDHKDTGDMTNVPVNGLLGRQVLNDARMWPTPRASENELRTTKPTPSQIAGTHGKSLSGEVQQGGSLKLNSAWVSRMMGYPDGWLTLDGEVIP